MGSDRPTREVQGEDRSRRTLGDLLYADGAAPVPESEWVAIIRSIAAGDQRALRALWDRTHRLVFTLIVRITDSRESAEELTLDVFHDVWRRAAAYDAASGSVVGWMLTQARSRAIDRMRFEQRKKRVAHRPDAPAPSTSVSDPQDVLALREQRLLLTSALGVLTPNERQAIEIAFFAGLTYAEVAERIDRPVGTVKTRIRAGLGKLRQALATKRYGA